MPVRSDDRADESTLVEYLALNEVWDPEATFLKAVRRVPPGFEFDAGRIRRWFTPPSPELTELTDVALVEAFWRRFADAVERAAGDKDVVVSMSGGLDSCAIAAAAVERLGAGRVTALTAGYERDFNDPEPLFARRVAEHLGISWGFVSSDRTDLVAAWDDVQFWPAEPSTAASVEWKANIPDGSVVLSGLGGDPLLRGDRKHYWRRLRRGQLAAAVSDAVRTVVLHGKRPALGWSQWLADPPAYERPRWLRPHPAFERAVRRRLRLVEACDRGVDELFASSWSYLFECSAPTNNPGGPRYAYPFFDVDFAEFLASVPTAPWCVDKEILRAALRGKIPETVRTRPKATVEGTPLATLTPRGAEMLEAVFETGSADHLIDRKSAGWSLEPGMRQRWALSEVLRAASVYRWLAFREQQS